MQFREFGRHLAQRVISLPRSTVLLWSEDGVHG